MEFEEKIKNFATRISEIKDSIKTEEATKTSIIMPFFQILGYDVFNPMEFTPEYIADVGIKKREKVDYAIVLNNEVVMLIEAKPINELLEKHDSQLFRYFGTSKAKFAILTNGINYKFYTDLEKTNVMDTTPFLDINLENINDNELQELKKFQKENFDIDKIFSTASDLKYLNLMKKVLKEEFQNPSDDFVKLILNREIYDGIKTGAIIEKYRPLLKKSISSYLNELINNRLQFAIQNNDDYNDSEEIDNDNTDKIITTVEEMQSFYTVKSILSEFCDSKKITYKDTVSYFGILYDNKVTKWICRVYLKENVKFLTIVDSSKKEKRYDIDSIDDIYKLRDELVQRLQQFDKKREKRNLEKIEAKEPPKKIDLTNITFSGLTMTK